MKRIFTFLVAVLLMASAFQPRQASAQSPEKMSYQAVIRNSDDALVADTQVGMQISIIQGSASGTSVYVETQTPTTNANGLVSIEIGGGTVVSGDFSAIDWANGPYFIETKTATTAPLTTYTITGTSQLLSVPYALHAKTAETLTEAITETDPTYTISEAAKITAADIIKLSDLSGANTGDQDLSVLASKTALGDSTALLRSLTPTSISDLSMNANSQNITNLADPVNAQDASTKAYVDALLARIEALEEPAYVFTDQRDGTNYEAVIIGNQLWMAENLKYLPSVAGPGTESETTPYCYVYGYDGTNVADAKATANYNTYGVLYNWPAAMNSCPTDWHLPSADEWTELRAYLGGESAAGGELKETGTTHWTIPNTGATNETGFTALPGGIRNYDGTFGRVGDYGYWWSATEDGTSYAWLLVMDYESSDAGIGSLDVVKEYGLSVRCVNDFIPVFQPKGAYER